MPNLWFSKYTTVECVGTFRILIPNIIQIWIQEWNLVKKQNNYKAENEKVLRVFQN